MSEHKHEWIIDDDYRWFKCECDESPSTEDILRSLNATECLSAEDANEASKYTPGFKGVVVMRIYDALKAYTRILERKD